MTRAIAPMSRLHYQAGTQGTGLGLLVPMTLLSSNMAVAFKLAAPVQAKPTKPIVELGPADPERARRGRDIAAPASQSRFIGRTFHIRERCAVLGRDLRRRRAFCVKRHPPELGFAGELDREWRSSSEPLKRWPTSTRHPRRHRPGFDREMLITR